jgi:hypothetical protein|tara:strand:+ start:271 stop:474 length:204 start_codon:yes stop_codon:yes gene_type:complete
MTYKKRLHDLNPCTSKEKAFSKTKKKIIKSKKISKKLNRELRYEVHKNTLQPTSLDFFITRGTLEIN